MAESVKYNFFSVKILLCLKYLYFFPLACSTFIIYINTWRKEISGSPQARLTEMLTVNIEFFQPFFSVACVKLAPKGNVQNYRAAFVSGGIFG